MLRKLLVIALAAIMLVGVVCAATASRNGHEINYVQREERSAEQEQRALEQIQAAEEMIAQADSLIDSLTCEPPHAAVVLLDQAKEHLANAREAFDEGKYGQAYGLANAAEMLARNAIRILEDMRGEDGEEAEEDGENEVEYTPAEENVEQPIEEDLETTTEGDIEQPVLYEVSLSYRETVLLQLIGYTSSPDLTFVGKGKVLTIKIVGPCEIQLGGTIEANVANNSNATISIEVYSFYHQGVISDSEVFRDDLPMPPSYVKSSVETVDLAPGETNTLSLGDLEPHTYTFGVVAKMVKAFTGDDARGLVGSRL